MKTLVQEIFKQSGFATHEKEEDKQWRKKVRLTCLRTLDMQEEVRASTEVAYADTDK